jgi:energy-coupling factor transporter transmembrane protein EcfT
MQLVHPLVWWLWALLLAAFVIRTNNTLIATAVACALTLVVLKLKSKSYWSGAFALSAKLALSIIAIRIAIAILIGVPMPGTVLFQIPEIRLPSWMVGIRIGGPVTSQRLSTAVTEALMIATLILLCGAASSLASPHRLIRSLPKAMFNLGVTLSVATSVLPQTVKSVARIQSAKRLRGQNIRGLRAWRGIALPLLEESLERALDLATAMESRGYGYHGKTSKYRAQKFQLVDVALITSVLYLLVLSPILIAQFTFGLLLAATVLIVALPIVIVQR